MWTVFITAALALLADEAQPEFEEPPFEEEPPKGASGPGHTVMVASFEDGDAIFRLVSESAVRGEKKRTGAPYNTSDIWPAVRAGAVAVFSYRTPGNRSMATVVMNLHNGAPILVYGQNIPVVRPVEVRTRMIWFLLDALKVRALRPEFVSRISSSLLIPPLLSDVALRDLQPLDELFSRVVSPEDAAVYMRRLGEYLEKVGVMLEGPEEHPSCLCWTFSTLEPESAPIRTEYQISVDFTVDVPMWDISRRYGTTWRKLHTTQRGPIETLTWSNAILAEDGLDAWMLQYSESGELLVVAPDLLLPHDAFIKMYGV